MHIVGHAALVGDQVTFALKDVLGERTPRRLDRLSEMACYVAALCHPRGFEADRAAVFFCTRFGNFSGTAAYLARVKEKGQRLANPIEFPNLVLSAPTGTLSMLFGMKGELLAFNDGALHALWAAQECLASNRADVALVVGAEEHSDARTRFAPGLLQEGAGAIVLDRRATAGPLLRVGAVRHPGRHIVPAVNAIIDVAQAATQSGTTAIADGGLVAQIDA